MILKLRIKLIMVSMFSLLAVLALIIGGSSAASYLRIASEADGTLSMLIENGGSFPDIDEDFEWGEEFGRRTMELPFESRYFSVRLSKDHEAVETDMGRIAAVDEETAVAYAKQVEAGGRENGFLGDYRFAVQQADGELRVFFLDCGRALTSFENFWQTSCKVALLGMLAVLALIVYFSARIVGPVAESYEKQKRFITDAGHEIKTPLAIIDADADVLSMECGESEWLQDIRSQVKRLTSLTNDLVFLSRMEEAGNRMQMLEFPLSDVVAETAQAFAALAKSQEKEFSVEVQPLLTMKGDEKMLRQLVSVLLDNAVKYSTDGGSIRLCLKKQGRSIRLSVFNTAEEMKEKDLSHLFDRFYRTDRSRNSETGGYGIGLSIASAVVGAHRGKISASTEDGRSLLVTASFPE